MGAGYCWQRLQPEQSLEAGQSRAFQEPPAVQCGCSAGFEFSVGCGEKAADKTHGLTFGLYPCKEEQGATESFCFDGEAEFTFKIARVQPRLCIPFLHRIFHRHVDKVHTPFS